MNKKKVFGIVGTGAMALGLLFGAENPFQAEASTPAKVESLKEYKTKLTEHKKHGERPAHVTKDAQTGVYVEIYAENPAEREALMKEQGWTEKDPIEIVNKAKDKPVKSKFEESVSLGFNFLGDNFGTISASAGVDTSSWDWVGTEYWNIYPDINKKERDTTWHSHGGDYSFILPAHSANALQAGKEHYIGFADLYDFDGGLNNTGDDYITTFDYAPSSYNIRYSVSGMSSWLDGGEAEPYTIHYQTYGKVENKLYSVRYYD
jgi:hypothetical protein